LQKGWIFVLFLLDTNEESIVQFSYVQLKIRLVNPRPSKNFLFKKMTEPPSTPPSRNCNPFCGEEWYFLEQHVAIGTPKSSYTQTKMMFSEMV